VEAIMIALSRNPSEKDWSVEISGNLYEHISTNEVDSLVEYAMLAAQQNLLEADSGERFRMSPRTAD
jgi:hypothetical protein